MHKTLVSVVIATYNSEKTILTAINSILQQTHENIEIIIIDGDSKDKTIQLIRQIKTSKIKWISEPDTGIYDALNKGVNLSTGEWIYILGSDDELLPNGIELLVTNSNDADIVYGNTIDRDEYGNTKTFNAKKHNIVRYVMFCSHQGMIMRRSMIRTMGGFNMKYPIRADYDLTLRCFLNKYKFKQINENIAFFSICGTSGQASLIKDWERYKITRDNKSIHFPFLYFMYVFSKKILKRLLVNLK